MTRSAGELLSKLRTRVLPHVRYLRRRASTAAQPWWPFALLLSAGSAFTLGSFGYWAQGVSVPSAVYDAVSLFVFDYQKPPGALSWELQLARLVAVVVTGTTVIGLLTIAFRRTYDRARIATYRGHIVVCGLGSVGIRLVQTAPPHTAVVAVEMNPFAAGVTAARTLGIPVILSDARDPLVLKQAGIGQAAKLFCLTGTAATNLAIVSALHAAVPQTGGVRRTPRVVIARMPDPEACDRLRAVYARSRQKDSAAVHVDAFSPGEVAAQQVVQTVTEGLAKITRYKVALIGTGPLATQVVRDLGRWMATTTSSVGGPSHLDLRVGGMGAADFAEKVKRDLDPELVTVMPCAADVPDTEVDARVKWAVGSDADAPDGIVACDMTGDAGLSMALALAEQREFKGLKVVCTSGSADQGQALQTFGVVLVDAEARACEYAHVMGGTLFERLAIQVHGDFLDDEARRLGRLDPEKPSHKPWEELDLGLKETNREQAYSIFSSLAGAGYRVARVRPGDSSIGADMWPEFVEQLARVEHERWTVQKKRQGWRFGEVRDEAARLHPDLVEWSALSELGKEKNRDIVRAWPHQLSRAGYVCHVPDAPGQILR